MMNIIVTSPPPCEPISLEELYVFLRLDPEGSPPEHPEDAMLTTFIQTGREKVEQATRRALVEQRIRMVLPCFPTFSVRFGSVYDEDAIERDASIELLRPPYQSIQSVRYYDQDNVLQTLATASYFVAEQAFVPLLTVAEGYNWPVTYGRADAVLIDYTVGYAPDGSPADDAGYRANIPAALKDAVKFEVQLLYDELPPDKRKAIEETIKRLVRSFVIGKF
jgi:uncharacterized phiE125 gp8 family phage protein